MMKTADARQGPRLAWFGRAWLNRSGRRRPLLQADVRAVFLVIGDIFAPQSPEVLIVQRDYVIKHFTANTADPALRHSVLPRAPNTGANGFHGTGLEKLDHIAAELGVTVEQDVAVGTGKRQSLAQLLYDPVAGRMLRDVEVEDPSATMLDNKEAIEDAKRQARNREEVECRDYLAVVVEKGEPALRSALIPTTV